MIKFSFEQVDGPQFELAKAIILSKLSSSDEEFNLTGLRAFGVGNMDSDWDFFAERSETVMSFLEDNRFEAEKDHVDVDGITFKKQLRDTEYTHRLWALVVNCVKSGMELG